MFLWTLYSLNQEQEEAQGRCHENQNHLLRALKSFQPEIKEELLSVPVCWRIALLMTLTVTTYDLEGNL